MFIIPIIVLPESSKSGHASVRVEADGHVIGCTSFMYEDGFIDGLRKVMFSDEHGEMMLRFMTASENERLKLQGKTNMCFAFGIPSSLVEYFYCSPLPSPSPRVPFGFLPSWHIAPKDPTRIMSLLNLRLFAPSGMRVR